MTESTSVSAGARQSMSAPEDDAEQADGKVKADGHALDLADEVEHDLHHTEHGHGSAEDAADHDQRRLGIATRKIPSSKNIALSTT